jgi:hypothetical protein
MNTLIRHNGFVEQSLGIFLGIIDRHPSVSKSNRSHVDIFRFFFIKLGIVYKFLKP